MIALSFEARSNALRRDQDGRAWIAWHVAALMRAKKLPSLKSMMGPDNRPLRQQTWQEMLDAVRLINASAGGRVKIKPKG